MTDIPLCVALPQHVDSLPDRDVFYQSLHCPIISTSVSTTGHGALFYLVEVIPFPNISLNENLNADPELHSSVWFVFYWNLLYAIVLIIVMVANSCVGDHGKARNYLTDTGCQDPHLILISTSVISVVSDLMILVIPIATIWGLHMAREKKIKLGAVFAVGSL